MTETRRVAVLLHPDRPEALRAASEFVRGMAERGIECLVFPGDVERVSECVPGATVRPISAEPAELAVVFGGDGSILRAAEWAQPHGIPLLGVNLGHVGFLAELEPSDLEALPDQVLNRDFHVEKRFTLQLEVTNAAGEQVWRSFAANEVSIEKTSSERMVQVQVSIDSRPVSLWSCDGVLVSTPTGSTAYAFSAGGPVMWPDVQGFLVVPLSAHALFARPLVLGPDAVVEVEIVNQFEQRAIIWCDGRRSFEAGPASRIRVVRGERPLLIARLAEQPFTTRLVKKFGLPVKGWRSNPGGSDAD